MERLGPVFKELDWVLCGRPGNAEHKRILPEYCHNILDVLRRTAFKDLPPLSEVVRSERGTVSEGKTIEGTTAAGRVNWRLFGRVAGLLQRCSRFWEFQVEPAVQQAGLLEIRPEEDKEIAAMLARDGWLKEKAAEFATAYPGVPLEELAGTVLEAMFEKGAAGLAVGLQEAYKAGPEAMSEFLHGMAEGARGLIDERGQFTGESNRAKLYWFLLLVWPEIKEMQESRPPKTRKDLGRWLKPFAEAGIVAMKDVEESHQLRNVCDDVGLKLAGRGAPGKSK